MKKKISLALALVTMFSAVSASAANIAGKTVRFTETEAFINTRNIESFMVSDHTCVDVNELGMYGFLVQWDAKARAIYVSANTIWSNTAWTGVGAPPAGWALYDFTNQWNATAGAYANAIQGPNTTGWGTNINPTTIFNNSAYDHLVFATTVPSDIKVYMNGNEVDSYHTGSRVLVKLRDLVLAGNGITKHYDPVNNRSWINVLKTDFNGAVLVPLYTNNIPQAALLSTGEAIRQANEYLANTYNGRLAVANSNGEEWRAYYPLLSQETFVFPVIDVATGIQVTTVSVNYAGVQADEVDADAMTNFMQAYYQR